MRSIIYGGTFCRIFKIVKKHIYGGAASYFQLVNGFLLCFVNKITPENTIYLSYIPRTSNFLVTTFLSDFRPTSLRNYLLYLERMLNKYHENLNKNNIYDGTKLKISKISKNIYMPEHTYGGAPL